MEKEKEVMEKITKYVLEECKNVFGFAGIAKGDDFVMINTGSGIDGQELIIEMKIKK